MTLDSATTANLGSLVGLNPSMGIIVLILGLAFMYLVKIIVSNTDLTSSVKTSVESTAASHNELAKSLSEIRADQIISNEERKAQASSIERLDSKVNTLDFDLICLSRELSRLKTGMAPTIIQNNTTTGPTT